MSKIIFFIFCITSTTYSQSYYNGVSNPRISIITSVFKGNQFIRAFLEDIVKHTIFDQCELIMINANSPDNEEEVIKEYMQQYPNIFYLKLDHDPGIYGVWNLAIKQARANYITNANLDDRVHHACYEIFAYTLDAYPKIDLVYSYLLRTSIANETVKCNHAHKKWKFPPFSLHNLRRISLPNDHPMWRKKIHEKVGYFDESFKIAGDYDMWIRMAKAGSAFMLVPYYLGLNYCNPSGLSTSSSSKALDELQKVRKKHYDFFTT